MIDEFMFIQSIARFSTEITTVLLLCQILDRECTGFIWHTSCDMSDVIKTEVYDVCSVKYVKSDHRLYPTPNPFCDHLLPSPASGLVSSFWLQ